MRLFVGVELAPAVVESAAALISGLRERTRELAPRARITWVPAERLHITVRFIGAVDAAGADAIGGVLEAALPLPPFDAAITDVGAFPRSGPPRVLWAGVAGGAAALQDAEREVTRRLESIGIPPEVRAFTPHVTLARVRDAAGLRARDLFAGVEHYEFGSSPVVAITLFESLLSPQGPTYRALGRTPLRV